MTMAAGVLSAAIISCSKVDDNRIPPTRVNIQFRNVGEWDIYGNPAACSVKIFDKEKGIPAASFFTATTFTGFGGVMLVADPTGEFRAYDRACPVEARRDAVVVFDADNPQGAARCTVCKSTFDIYNYGAAVSGRAADMHYGLRRLRVSVVNQPTCHAVITD